MSSKGLSKRESRARHPGPALTRRSASAEGIHTIHQAASSRSGLRVGHSSRSHTCRLYAAQTRRKPVPLPGQPSRGYACDTTRNPCMPDGPVRPTSCRDSTAPTRHRARCRLFVAEPRPHCRLGETARAHRVAQCLFRAHRWTAQERYPAPIRVTERSTRQTKSIPQEAVYAREAEACVEHTPPLPTRESFISQQHRELSTY